MRKASHVQYDIEYHIVWTTKYRYRVLNGRIAERTREIIRQSCNSMNVIIIKGAISKEHVHLLVSCPPSLSVSKLVQQLKGKTSRVLLSEYKELKKRYWGQHLWSTGYFVRSVGTVTQSTIKEYIENQQDEYEENFKIMGWVYSLNVLSAPKASHAIYCMVVDKNKTLNILKECYEKDLYNSYDLIDISKDTDKEIEVNDFIKREILEKEYDYFD